MHSSMFAISNNKHFLRPKCKKVTNLRTLIQYSAIAFCLSSTTVASSFSIDPHSSTASVRHLKTSASFGSFPSRSSTTHSFTFSPLTLENQSDFKLGTSLSMSSFTTATNNLNSLTDAEGAKGLASSTALTPGEKLEALRSKMKELNIDAYIVPSDDPHLSEYVPEAYMRRKFLTGFGGSAGTAVVFQKEACLWTDSRYHNEASLQIDAEHWTLMKQGLPKVPSLTKYIAEAAALKYEKGQEIFRVGIDPFVHAASFEKDLMDAFQEQVEKLDLEKGSNVSLGEIDTLDHHGNLIDQVWGGDRPAIPTSPFRVHPIEYAGVSVSDKIEEIREKMKEKKATLCVFSALDDVAYLFNVRAKGDIDTCPVGIAYGAVTLDDVTLFCHEEKLTMEQVREHLKESGVTVKPYDGVIDEIKNHLSVHGEKAKIWMDKTRSNYAISRIVPEKSLLNKQNPVTPMKACKNKEEMEGMKRAHIVDGAAMANFIAWLENEIVTEGRSVSEVDIDKVLRSYRAQQPGYVEDSFPTIAGVGSNGAIIHYRAKADSDLMKHLDTNNPILIDSGGQYTYGTTDVTRTWHFGEATDEFKENYTRVLKGNIGVDVMVFPTNTPGFVLDVFARKSLWEAGFDYGHGTGHGVGAALNVHEGPHSISPRWTNMEVMKKGMVVSNEPGLYEDGKFGIRIENLLECTYVLDEDNKAHEDGIQEGEEGFPEKPIGKKTFLRFNKLTMIPIQKNLIDLKLMTTEELDWLDAYHQEIFEKVSPLLEANSPGLAWLTKACEKIDRKY